MNERDQLVAIKAKLVAQTWTGGSNVVFPTGSVLITRGLNIEEALKSGVRTPFALIVPGAAQADPQHGEDPNLMVGEVTIRIGVVIPGDAVGENPLMGANRPDTTKSEGAGLFQVQAEVFNAIGELNTQNSVTLQFRNTADRGAILLDDKTYIAFEDHTFESVFIEAP